MVSLILVSFALALFVVYNVAVLIQFGFPWSLSESYYLYENKKKGLGWLFSIFMWVMSFSLMPAWITTSYAVGDWMQYFTVFAFLSAASMMFVGAAPRYKGFESKIHTIAAIICAVSAMIWNFAVGWNVYYIPMSAALIPIIIASVTKTWKSSREYWLEMIAFDSTFAVLITECAILL